MSLTVDPLWDHGCPITVERVSDSPETPDSDPFPGTPKPEASSESREAPFPSWCYPTRPQPPA